MSKQTRQRAIMDIIHNIRIQNQSELTAELKKVGFSVTQATVCRDIAELKLLKSHVGYMLSSDARKGNAWSVGNTASTLRQWVVKVEKANNLVIVKTLWGMAQQVGIAFDNGHFDGVVGTIAGSDTVALITQSIDRAQELNATIEEMIA